MRRSALLLAVGALVTGMGLPAEASAGPTESVTLVLSAPDPTGLQALAHAKRLSADARRARFLALEPGQAVRSQVTRELERLGLHVDRSAHFTVEAHGPAAAVLHAFGSARAAEGSTGRSHALPLLPLGLRGVVLAAYGGDDVAPRYLPRTTKGCAGGDLSEPAHSGITGSDVCNVYHQSHDGNDPVGAGGQIIATLQFAGWHEADLTDFANQMGLPDPVAGNRITQVSVDGASFVGTSDEVTLDQEALLAAAPGAAQRAYFTTNDAVGSTDALAQMVSDVVDAHLPIVAMSTSWGFCEDNFDGFPADLAADRQSFTSLVAAGVTVFSSSGDNGAYDCYGQPGMPSSEYYLRRVDVPAAYPDVVGVGGTTLDSATSPTADIGVWGTPTAVTTSSAIDAAVTGVGGGGGGVSRFIARPGYQSAAGIPLVGTRMVPDIAAMADPNTGLLVRKAGHWGVIGGTSLAAPIEAALFTDALAHAGYASGLGDIHDLLYSAPASAFRDITSGTNLYYSARSGYDLATGLGAPLWEDVVGLSVQPALAVTTHVVSGTTVPVRVTTSPAVVFPADTLWQTGTAPPACDGSGSASPPTSVTIPATDGVQSVYVRACDAANATVATASALVRRDSVAPSFAMSAALATPTSSTVKVSLAASDPGSGVAGYWIRVRHVGGSVDDVAANTIHATTFTFSGVGGRTYVVYAHSVDFAGNTAPTRTVKITVPLDDSAFSYSGAWSRVTSTADFKGASHDAKVAGASAKVTSTGKLYTLWMRTGPAGGYVDVYLGSTKIKRYSTYSSANRFRVPFTLYSSTTAAARTFTFKVEGAKVSSSKGYYVYLDALVPAQ